MGSLMAGWSSPSHDPKYAYERNKSFTNEEVEAYWRSHKRTEEQHPNASLGSPKSFQNTRVNELKGLQRSNSLPVTDRNGNFLNVDSETALHKLMKKNDWWTRSNWAFLNEPPVIEAEGPSYKYASQYHITNFASSKPDTHQGIST